MGQRTFETRSLYLILAEKLFTLPAANEMLPLSALFAGKYREVLVEVILGSAPHLPSCSRLTGNPHLTLVSVGCCSRARVCLDRRSETQIFADPAAFLRTDIVALLLS